MNIYACSDIHGQYSLFKRMLEDIRFSEDDLLYILGDIIDRGPESIPMLLDIMSRSNIMCMIGNHELMMYTEYRVPQRESYWLYSANGGTVTKRAFSSLTADKREEILDFIENMALQIDLTVDDTHYLLSHSDFIKEKNSVLFKDVSYDEAFNTVWNSPWRMWEYVPKKKYASDGRVHVIGHVPTQYIDENSSKTSAYIDRKNGIVNIDLGCARMANRIGRLRSAEGYSLCCMNLTEYAKGAGEKAFTYYN